LIYHSKLDEYEYFNLIEDPKEKVNLFSQNGRHMKKLKANLSKLMDFAGQRSDSETKALDTETIKELKSLGYIK
jgi:hypothetical protein